MVKIDAVSATSTPMWLLISTFLFVALRCGMTIVESINPPVASAEIQWRTPEQITETERHGNKLFFYDFTAEWCDPCIQMNKTAFQSKDVVALLNNEFIPIKVVDKKRENGKNASRIQSLEDQFNVEAFPTIVVTVPTGSKISDHLGAAGTQAMKKYLRDALTVASYSTGKEKLIISDFEGAAKSFDEYLNRTKWHHYRWAYAAIFSSIAHRCQGQNDEADAVLKKALAEAHDRTFPVPIIEYLNGKISFDQLLQNASENKTNRVLAYAYAAMNEFSKHEYEKAFAKFEWVMLNCEEKDSFEYRITSNWIETTKGKLADAGKNWRDIKPDSSN